MLAHTNGELGLVVITGPPEMDDLLQRRAQRMVKFHVAMQACAAPAGADRSTADAFPERGPYGQISIRELLKFVNHLQWYAGNRIWNDSSITTLLAIEAWYIYGARFRSTKARQHVKDLITQDKGWKFAPSALAASPTWEWVGRGAARKLAIGAATVHAPEEDSQALANTHIATLPENQRQRWGATIELICRGHTAAVGFLAQRRTIEQHGIVAISKSWLRHWRDTAIKAGATSPSDVTAIGCGLYARRLRATSAGYVYCS